jgi:acyl-CoA thioester hydrolase
MGIAHHGSYFVWMEAARTELLREYGLSYRELETRGFLLPVREAHCRYRRSVQYDDMVVIQSWIERLGGASLHIAYSISKEGSASEPIAEGYTLHACTDRSGVVVKVPDFFRDLFRNDRR